MSMQRRLSGLSADDADTYLRLRLTRGGEAAIPAPVRQRIVDASGGVMVIRVMRDLTFEERSLPRASTLVDRFDTELLHAAVPNVRDAAVQRFLSRPIVQAEESGWLRCSVDEYIRDAVREHDTDTDDAWSPTEWRAAAARMTGGGCSPGRCPTGPHRWGSIAPRRWTCSASSR
jgi:hypothetical protein